jgi:hypothetical protein
MRSFRRPRGFLIYCSDYHCSHWTAINGDRWADDVRPNFHWEEEARRAAVPGLTDAEHPSTT